MSASAKTRAELIAPDLDFILEHMRPLQKDLQGARIFITGGTGFIGTWLLESLAHANDQSGLGLEALVLTRNVEAFARKAPHLARRPDIHFHTGDVRDFTFPPAKFSHVIHAATAADEALNTEHPDMMCETIVNGTRRALDFAVRCGAQQFLLTSSGAVYGPQPPTLERTPEDFPGGPDLSGAGNAYEEGEKKIAAHLQKEKSRAGAIELHHIAKAMSEMLCAQHAREHGMGAKVARIYALVGPYMPLELHFAMGNFIRDALAGSPIRIKGDGTPYRSYLYAADLTIWLWTILIRGAGNRPYNVGSRQPVSIAELAAAVSRALPGRVPIEIAQKPVAGQLPARYVPENMRAQEELGLREWTSLEEGIRRTAQWYESK